MIELIKELLSKTHKRGFLVNKIELTCPECGHIENSTYYELLKNLQFEVLEPTTVPNPFIMEAYYEDEVTATPIKFKIQCPRCSREMEAFSPVPLEYILNIIQSPPPDDIMYG